MRKRRPGVYAQRGQFIERVADDLGPALVEHRFARLHVPFPGADARALDDAAQAALALEVAMMDPRRLHQLPDGCQQRVQELDHRLLVAPRPVGDAEEGNELVPHADRDAEKRVQGRMPLREPPTARVVRRVVGDHRLTAGQRRTEQRVEVEELQAGWRVLFEEAAARIVPGNVGDGVGLQVGTVVRRVQDLADESVLAVGEVEHVVEQAIEGPAPVALADELRLGTGDDFHHPLLAGQFTPALDGLHPQSHVLDQPPLQANGVACNEHEVGRAHQAHGHGHGAALAEEGEDHRQQGRGHEPQGRPSIGRERGHRRRTHTRQHEGEKHLVGQLSGREHEQPGEPPDDPGGGRPPAKPPQPGGGRRPDSASMPTELEREHPAQREHQPHRHQPRHCLARLDHLPLHDRQHGSDEGIRKKRAGYRPIQQAHLLAHEAGHLEAGVGGRGGRLHVVFSPGKRHVHKGPAGNPREHNGNF